MIEIFTKPNCAFCVQAKNLLNRHHKIFTEIPIGESILVEELKERYPQAATAPVVVIDGIYVGGYKELQEIFESNAQLLTE